MKEEERDASLKMGTCPEKSRLAHEYADATSELFSIATTLTSKTGAAFHAALAKSKIAREECAKKHRELQDHVAQHGC